LVVPPTTGTVRVTTTTSGAEPDADGYTASLDGGAEQSIGASTNLAIEAVTPGTHTVELAGIAANCTVAGENPRTASVTAGETAEVAFAIDCSATIGSLVVSSSTTGPSPDPDGFAVNVDGVDRGFLTATGNLTIDGLVAGDHLIGLSGVAGNCQVQGNNPQTVTIVAAGSATTDFAIICTAPPANAGNLRITTATTGADLDADGYKFAVDGGSTQTIAINTTTPPITNLAAGPHTVSLSSVAANCTVTAGLSRPVTITAGGTADVSFAVTCSATTGSIKVTTQTSGSNLDNGYSVKVDAGTAQDIGANTTLTLNGITAGDRVVTLSGIAGNCEADNTSRPAPVTAGTTTEVAFSVTCTAPTSGPGSWTLRARIPTVRQGLAGAVVQNASGQYIFYAIGGVGGVPENNPALDKVEVYNAATNAWSGGAPLPSARAWIRASAIDGNIYVPGGADADGAYTRTLYVYSPTKN
jgi:preprotein translocase subunit YajC